MPNSRLQGLRSGFTPTLGALFDGAGTTFRVWAPDHDRVDLVVENAAADAIRALEREPSGYWSGRFEDLRPGTWYRYRLNGKHDQVYPDPASRFQPEGVHGPSQVIDPSSFQWSDAAWRPPSLGELVFYELHVGTFSPAGTFRGALERLPDLVDLGVTAIELMPVADFPGCRNWGYDGVALFAPARCYGCPDDLRALVDAAHARGLAVFLDVVYNHLGPDGAYANAFSPHYFTEAHRSPWGRGVNLDGPLSAEVRRFFIENAMHWLREYHIDGLRLDATHAMQDESPRHFLAELTSTIHADSERPAIVVAEDHRNLAQLLLPIERGGYGVDGVWADDFHHQARVHTAGDCEGYFVDYTGSTTDLAVTMRQGWFFTGQHSPHLDCPRGSDPTPLEPHQFIICIQNHDQIGNRADGARLNQEIDLATYRALTALLLLAPQTPLLFMGQEWAASTPFLFFTDHHEELGISITQGRRAEFAAFTAFADPERRLRIPDPQAGDTFERSRLAWDERTREPHAGTLRLHRALLSLRRTGRAWREVGRDSYAASAPGEHTVMVTLANGRTAGDEYVVVARVSGCGTVTIPGAGSLVLTTEDSDFAADPQAVSILATTAADGTQQTAIHFARPGAVVLQRHLV